MGERQGLDDQRNMGNRGAELQRHRRGARYPPQLRRRLDCEHDGSVRKSGRRQSEVRGPAQVSRTKEVRLRANHALWHQYFPLMSRHAATIFALLALCSLPAIARVNVVTLPGRDSALLTIYNSVDLTLVKETRTLTFRKGLNRLEFSWANTLIDPTSVEFRALIHADAVEVLDVSFPPRVTNTLEWRINSEFAGEVEVEIRYFTIGISWSADYVAEADKAEKLMGLAGYVRVNNNSGEDYENAQIRLVVGVIRLVEDIAQLARDAAKDKAQKLPMTQLLREEDRLD